MIEPKFGKYNIIICGSRDFNNYDLLKKNLDNLLRNTKTTVQLVSGIGTEIDALTARYAKENNYKLLSFPTDWDHWGLRAISARNELMAEFSTHCIAFIGTNEEYLKDMLVRVKKYDLALRVIEYE